MLRQVLLHDRIHHGLHALPRGLRTPPRHHPHPVVARVHDGDVVHHAGRPDVRMMLHFDPAEARPRDADHLQRLAIHHHGLPERARIGIEAIAPELVAQNRHGMGFRSAIVLLGDQPAERRPHAQKAEVVARHILELGELHSVRALAAEAALGHAGARRRPIEHIRAPGQVEIQRIRDKSLPPAARAVEVDELLGMGHRQHAQHQRVYQREDRRVGADAQRQRQHRRRRESRVAQQAAQRVSGVLHRRFEPRDSAAVAIFLLGLRHAAELPPRRQLRLGRRHAARAEFLFEHGEMEPDFIAELAVQASASKQRGNTAPNRSHRVSYSTGRRKRCISATVRAQSSDSRPICLRPARVRS